MSYFLFLPQQIRFFLLCSGKVRRKQRAGLIVRGYSGFGRILITRYHRNHHFKVSFLDCDSCIKYKKYVKVKSNGQRTFVRVTSRLACLAELSGQVLMWHGEGKGNTGEMCVPCAQGSVIALCLRYRNWERFMETLGAMCISQGEGKTGAVMADSTASLGVTKAL